MFICMCRRATLKGSVNTRVKKQKKMLNNISVLEKFILFCALSVCCAADVYFKLFLLYLFLS